jgi:hypothetical protein
MRRGCGDGRQVLSFRDLGQGWCKPSIHSPHRILDCGGEICSQLARILQIWAQHYKIHTRLRCFTCLVAGEYGSRLISRAGVASRTSARGDHADSPPQRCELRL